MAEINCIVCNKKAEFIFEPDQISCRFCKFCGVAYTAENIVIARRETYLECVRNHLKSFAFTTIMYAITISFLLPKNWAALYLIIFIICELAFGYGIYKKTKLDAYAGRFPSV